MSHPVDIHVGKRLRERRTHMGMSQEALAQTSGITFQQVQKYERGVNRLSASRIFEFATVLGVSVKYFFDGLYPEGSMLGGVAEDAVPFDHELVSDESVVAALGSIEDEAAKKHLKGLIIALAKGDKAYS